MEYKFLDKVHDELTRLYDVRKEFMDKMDTLPPREQALALNYFSDYSVCELSFIFGKTRKWVKVRRALLTAPFEVWSRTDLTDSEILQIMSRTTRTGQLNTLWRIVSVKPNAG